MPTSPRLTYPDGATYVLRAGPQDELPSAEDGPVHAYDPGAGLGNLGATLAWARQIDVPPGGARLVHDGGAASRANAWATALGGRRSRLPLPGRWPTLLDAALAWAPPLRPGTVDLLWTSQLVAPPTSAPPDAALVKWVAEIDAQAAGATDLGWFAQGARLTMLPGRRAADARALRAWSGGARLVADVGNARVRTSWLVDRASAWDGQPCDLDPQLTAPWLAGERPELGPPDVALWEVPSATWWRLRSAREVHAALRDPGLLGRLTEGRPCLRATAGGVRLDDLSSADLAAGVHIGGCWLHDVVLTDVHLAAGSHLQGVTAVAGEGRWTARDAVILQTRGDLDAADALIVCGVGDPRATIQGVWAGERHHAWTPTEG